MLGTISITNVPQIPFLVSLPTNACDISTGLLVTGFSNTGIQYNNNITFDVFPAEYRPIVATPVAGTYYNAGVSNDRAHMLAVNPLPTDASGNRVLSSAAGATFGVVNYVSWQMSTPPDCNVMLLDNPMRTVVAKGDSIATYASNLPRGACATHADADMRISTCSNLNPWDVGFPANVFNIPSHWNGFQGCTDGCSTAFGGVPHSDTRTYYPATAFDCSTEGLPRTCAAGTLGGSATHVQDTVASCVSTCTPGGGIAPGPVGFPGGVCVNPLPATAVASYADATCCGGTAIRRCNFMAGDPIEYICSGAAPPISCPTQSLSWVQGVQTCSANFTSIPASSTSPSTNTTAASTAGSATADCRADGTWVPASGTCVSTAPPITCVGGTLGSFDSTATSCSPPGDNPWVRPANITTAVFGTFLGDCPGTLQQGEYCVGFRRYTPDFCPVAIPNTPLTELSFYFCTPSTLVCGTANNTTPIGAAPTSNLCSDGSTPAVTDAGTFFNWSCGTNYCTAPKILSDCPGGPRSWTIGADTCSATFPATSPGMATSSQTNITAGKSGSARFTCETNGLWNNYANPGATCGSDSCQNYRTDMVFNYTETFTLPTYGSNSNDALRATCDAGCSGDPDCSLNCYWTYPPQDYLATTPAYAGLYSRQFGGGGGGYFSDECPPGQFINRMTGRSGNYVDGIQAHCSGGTSLPYHGGGGGGPFLMDCGANFLTGIRGRSGSYLDFLATFCSQSADNSSVFANASGGGGGGEFAFSCPKGSVISGISGRSGRFIDALAVRCKPATELQVCACPTLASTWTQGANTCNGNFYTTRAGDLSFLTNTTTAGFDGTARLSCLANGTWAGAVEAGSTCSPRALCGGVPEPVGSGPGCGGTMRQVEPGGWFCNASLIWEWYRPLCVCRSCPDL